MVRVEGFKVVNAEGCGWWRLRTKWLRVVKVDGWDMVKVEENVYNIKKINYKKII